MNESSLTRNSSIELLRILAMFLVLVVHADFYSIGVPQNEEAISDALPTITRFFFQSISIGCVNLFVLISGWFSIQPKMKGFLKFIFQCIFYLCGIYAVCVLVGYVELSKEGVLECLVMTQHNWFIKSYVLLYFISPILNTYVDYSSYKDLRNILIAFLLFQTIYGWATASAIFFAGGYSTMSFIGLYLLARFARKYPNRWTTMSYSKDLYVFFTIIIIQTVFAYISCRYVCAYFTPINARIFSYINPLVIISSLYLLLGFSKMKINSRFINRVAISCFSVFLLHQNANIIPFFKESVNYIYSNTSGLLCICLEFFYLTTIFVVAIFVDYLRIYVYNNISDKLINHNK